VLFPKDISAQVQPPEDLRKIGMDPYSQPDIHMDLGKNKYEYYGSGDVNNDEEINYADVSAMQNGIKNDMADIDGDGTPSTANDQQILIDYLNGNIDNLPSNWNHLNGIEKRSWLEKMIAIDKVDENPYIAFTGNNQDSVYDCGMFSREALINFFGVDSLDNYIYAYKYSSRHGDENARFNIPVYMTFNKVTPGIEPPAGTEPTGHNINAILVGPDDTTRYQEDPTNFNHWYFFEPQTDEEVHPGDFSMNPNKPVKIMWWGYDQNWANEGNAFGYNSIVEFDLQNGQATTTWVHPWLLTSNPNDTLVSVEDEGGLEQSVQSFDLDNAYPNPTNGFVNVPYTTDKYGKVTFEVYNALGQKIDKIEKYAEAGKNVFSYDLTKLPSGAYLIIGINSEGKQAAIKVLNMK
jgi:hypothetical protein